MATRRKPRTVEVAYENRRRRASVKETAASRAAGKMAAEEAGRAAAYDSQVANLLVTLGAPDPAGLIARNREQLQLWRAARVDASTAAALLDAGRNRYAGMGVRSIEAREGVGEASERRLAASEAPTGREWQVIVENPPPANRGQILSMTLPGEGYAVGNKIVLGGFYDDQEAAQVARAITKRFGSYTSFGPKNDLRSAAESGSSCGCGGSCSACKTGVGSHTHEAHEERGDVPFLLSVIRENLRARALEMAFVPDVTEVLVEQYAWTWDRVKKAFTDASIEGLIDLQPESGMGRLTKREKLMCVPGPEGTRLSWVVLRAQSGAAEERGGTTQKEIIEIDIVDKTSGGNMDASVCRPFTRVVRDRHLYEMCLARAKTIGEIADHRKIYDLVRHDMEERTVESFFVVKVDFRGQLIDYLELARGQQHRVSVDTEDILHGVFNAVLSHDKCDGFAIIHNHPSGHARPSPADKHLTDRVREAGAIALPNTALIDHIVVGMGEYYSFTDKKLYRVKK